jgi:hypothetical protein
MTEGHDCRFMTEGHEMRYLIVLLGGALRHGVNVAAARLLGTALRYATAFENITGSLLMGLLAGYFAFRSGISLALAVVPDHRHSRRLHHLLDILARCGAAVRTRRAWAGRALRRHIRAAVDLRVVRRALVDALHFVMHRAPIIVPSARDQAGPSAACRGRVPDWRW